MLKRRPAFLRVCLVALTLTIGSSLGIGIAPSASAADITYIYDALGRLVAVVDPSTNEVAIYRYDAVGNLLSITRQSAATVSIIDFTPTQGPVGTTVRISGMGFSAVPAENAVAFNGAAATVTSSAPTSIVTSVPAGATTGPITVTAPSGSATSGCWVARQPRGHGPPP